MPASSFSPSPQKRGGTAGNNNNNNKSAWTDADRALIVRAYIETSPAFTPAFFTRLEELLPHRDRNLVKKQWNRRIEREILGLFGGSAAAVAGGKKRSATASVSPEAESEQTATMVKTKGKKIKDSDAE